MVLVVIRTKYMMAVAINFFSLAGFHNVKDG